MSVSCLYHYISPSEFDKQSKPIDGHGQDKTILKGYIGNLIQEDGIKVILGKWNNQSWRFVAQVVESQEPILIGLNTMRKMGIFTRHPEVSTESTDIHQEQQNQARCDPMEIKLSITQGTAGPAAETQFLGELRTLRHQQDKGM